KVAFLKHRLFPILLIILLGLFSYSNTLNSSFHFDDFTFIIENPNIKNIDDIPSIFKTILPQSSRFVCFLTFALNYKVHGLGVFGYHLTNLAIHLTSAILVWWLVILLCASPKLKLEFSKEDVSLLALLTALVFVVHPVQTQAVSYISQRFASLATMFYLACVCFFIKGRLVLERRRIKRGVFLGLSAAAMILAMYTKEIAITLPIIILIVDRSFISKGRQGRFYWISMALVLTSIIIIPVMFDLGIKELFLAHKASASHSGDMITLPTYLLTQFRVFVTFIRLLVIPYGQNLDYDFALSKSIFETATMFCIAIVTLMIFFALKIKRSNKIAFFGIVWFFVTFAPNLVPRRFVIFEHKIYLLSAGFCIFFNFWLFQKCKNKKFYVNIVSVIIAVFALMTFQRNKVWENEITLWTDVLAKSPNKVSPKVNLGNAYVLDGQFDIGLKYLNKAIDQDPKHYKAYLNRGVAYENKKDYLNALADYTKAIDLKPHYAKAYGNRGFIYDRLKKYDLALDDYENALKADPKIAKVYSNRGVIYKNREQLDLALDDYNKAIALDPRIKEAYGNRGVVYFKKGLYDLAISDQNVVIKMDPQNPIPYINRSFAYYGKNDIIGALKSAKIAQSLGFKRETKYIDQLILEYKKLNK
ncbi:MAG: tetratricopeptide repeat protein, partial [Candidatus Omnitrophica bacterium]|nr:tetratricopeptide repeat protein [Candidatus Omnitrophota bacterium]